jgi:Skp family chaperone for outer membrane proteins
MIHFKTSFSALLLASAAVSAPATAQVAGIATLDSTDAIMQSKAFSTGYQQVGTSYAAYAQQINAKRKEINDINAQLDTNKDKNLTQAELDAAIKAKSPLIAQLETKEKEVAGLQDPIVKAQAFVVESVADKYLQAQQQVVTQKKISMILSPDAFIWAPDSVDITAAVTAALDQIVPSVTITPPANWQPKQSTGPLYEQVSQRFVAAARAQAMRNAQAQPGVVPLPAPAAPKPGTPAPKPAPQPDSR